MFRFLFERDFGELVMLESKPTITFLPNGDIEKVEKGLLENKISEYYKRYYFNKFMLKLSKLPSCFNIDQKKCSNRAFVIYKDSSLLYSKLTNVRTIKPTIEKDEVCEISEFSQEYDNYAVKDTNFKPVHNLIKICNGDMIFDPEIQNIKFNQQFMVYQNGKLYSFENRLMNIGSISKKFYVPKYHPLHFCNVDPQHFYIHIKNNHLDDILVDSDGKKFRHKDYPDITFVFDDNFYNWFPHFFTLKVTCIFDNKISVKMC
tara:strand:- start:3583 stop:4362 length:780 start_codon:yes stop_codon:yes gene_type:complete